MQKRYVVLTLLSKLIYFLSVIRNGIKKPRKPISYVVVSVFQELATLFQKMQRKTFKTSQDTKNFRNIINKFWRPQLILYLGKKENLIPKREILKILSILRPVYQSKLFQNLIYWYKRFIRNRPSREVNNCNLKLIKFRDYNW